MKTITNAEIQAYKLMTKGQNKDTGSYMYFNKIHEAANELILLAEKIKAERIVALMNIKD